MLALLVAPRFGALTPGLQLRAGAEELRSDFRRVRSIALGENRESTLTIDSAARTWSGAGGKVGGRLPETVGLTLVVARQEQRGETAGGVRFYPDGTSTGGTVTLVQADRRLVLSIDWFDGHVSIDDDAAR